MNRMCYSRVRQKEEIPETTEGHLMKRSSAMTLFTCYNLNLEQIQTRLNPALGFTQLI